MNYRRRKSINKSYPVNWDEIAKQVKDEAGWRCIRCGHIHDPKAGYTLTVHHLDMNPQNNEWWNLLALCQRCHLKIQNTVILEQGWLFEHSDWFKPYVAGYYAKIKGYPIDKKWVIKNMEYLLNV